MATKYVGTDFGRIVSGGGSVRVTIATTVGQGNGGTSIPCKGCFVVPSSTNSGRMRVNIGVAATAILGIELNDADEGNPTFFHIDDVSSLYFFGTNDDTIDIMYFLG